MSADQQNVEKAGDDAQWVVEVDEPEQPDPKTLLMAYMLRDGYTGAEVLAYLDRWPSHFPSAEPEPRRILMTEPYDGHPATEECPGCPHEPSRLPARSVDEEWARYHYTVVRSHGCDDPAPECACGSPLTPHLPSAVQNGGDHA